MNQAKLFIMGQERELLWVSTNYHRLLGSDGSPSSGLLGGLITVCFSSQAQDDFLLHWMTKESQDRTWNEVDKMEAGKICFYADGFDYPPYKTWEFNDAHLVYYREIFHAIGVIPMQTVITISPAIQDYGSELVKFWQASWIPPYEGSLSRQAGSSGETEEKKLSIITLQT